MIKKEYKKPVIRAVELKSAVILAGSTPEPDPIHVFTDGEEEEGIVPW